MTTTGVLATAIAAATLAMSGTAGHAEGITSSGSAPAAIHAATFGTAVHGTVRNNLSVPVKITTDWCKATKGPCRNSDIRTLKAKSTSSNDIDGFQVPNGKKYWVEYDALFGTEKRCVGSGWHKISDTTVARIHRTC
ncbi:hypothetical protein [Amycolatopsis sp. NPDC052450]|uniref:hypothetical protein n=1 Tax=Amycolatopsis sp. NPDC052450 TaxID=3363937 RepID=UPI0037C9130A